MNYINKMDKSLGLLAALAAGVGLYFIAEQTPEGKKAISNIHQAISNVQTSLVPVVYHGTPPAGVTPKGVCRPGLYLDQTDGILTCVDPHGIKELPNPTKQHIQNLNPNPRIAYPDQGIAYGIRYVDNDYWGYSGKPKKGGGSNVGSCPPGMECSQSSGNDQVAKYPNSTNPDWHEFPSIKIGFADQQPNMTQPLVQPDINKQIESQIKKGHQKEVKHQKNLDDKRLIREKGNVVTAQVECPKDLSQLNCGSHCYKNGKLMAVDCSGQKNKKNKTPPLVIPPNFPSQVTVEPYPSQEDIGGAAPDTGDTPSLDLNPPNQQPIKPTVPVTSPTPIAPPPPPLIPGGRVFYPFTPAKDKKGFAKLDTSYNLDGCRNVHYNSGPNGWTCRWQADDKTMRANIGENGYKIEANLHIGPPKPGMTHDKEISITSGGPGSASGTGNCCGFTTRVNIDTGELQLEAEGPAKTERIFCKGKSCTGGGKSSIAKIGSNGKPLPLYGQNIQLTWIVTKRGGRASYQAIATGPGGTIMATLPNPQVRGKDLIPFHYIQADKIADDPHRIRVDTADMKRIDFGTPKVTVIPANAYYGNDGYIEDEGLLI